MNETYSFKNEWKLYLKIFYLYGLIDKYMSLIKLY